MEKIEITALPVDVVQYNYEDDNDSFLLKNHERQIRMEGVYAKFC